MNRFATRGLMIVAWLLTPVSAWAVSFLGGWLGAAVGGGLGDPGALGALGAGAVLGAVVGAGAWVFLVRRLGRRLAGSLDGKGPGDVKYFAIQSRSLEAP